VIEELVSVVVAIADREPERFELVVRLAAQYPGDPGILVAILLNHVTLNIGECLWLPAGNIHAYLRGIGIELMGPSDNVLRGGLTPKHIDVAELLAILDFTDGPPPRLAPDRIGSDIVSYRPSNVPSGVGVAFELCEITGDATFSTSSPAIGVLLDGEFVLRAGDTIHLVRRGEAVFIPEATDLSFAGHGRFFLASADRG
jgi:mannose-6-phosphate isomerase